MLRLAVRYGLVALLLVACAAAKPTPGPLAGHVVFGASYNPSTFVLSGPTTKAQQGHDIAFAAHFTRRVAKGQIHLLGVLNGHTVLDQAINVTNGPWSVYGGTIPGGRLPESGALLMRFVDDGNVLLSSGTLTVTPVSSGSPGTSVAPGSPGPTSPPGTPGGGGGGDPSPT